VIPLTRKAIGLLEILLKEKFISSFEEARRGSRRLLLVTLRYADSNLNPVITTLKSRSTRGLRIYNKAKKIEKVLDGYGTAIISTSKGLMTDRDARRNKIGGEVLCQLY
jgi:small subunit ribosomal protein S8